MCDEYLHIRKTWGCCGSATNEHTVCLQFLYGSLTDGCREKLTYKGLDEMINWRQSVDASAMDCHP